MSAPVGQTVQLPVVHLKALAPLFQKNVLMDISAEIIIFSLHFVARQIDNFGFPVGDTQPV